MENHKPIIDPLDEALKFVYLNTGSNSDFAGSSTELSNITNGIYDNQISPDKAELMINSLYEKLAVDSLGALISKAIEAGKVNVEEIAVASALPVSAIEQLQGDLILANSIPVVPFNALLKKLQIPFEKAQKGIVKTFHIIKSEINLSPLVVNSMQLAYRRKNSKNLSAFNSKSSRAESLNLFQNEEALNKYLTRLKELYNIA